MDEWTDDDCESDEDDDLNLKLQRRESMDSNMKEEEKGCLSGHQKMIEEQEMDLDEGEML